MQLRLADGSELELGAGPFEQSSQIPSWTRYGGYDTYSGAIVNREEAAGLPAASAAIRLVSETVGMVPLIIYQGEPPDRERARDSWQWDLLHDQPNEETSAFDFWQDISTSIETTGNAFVWKVKVDPGRVNALYALDPNFVGVKRVSGRKVFSISMPGQTARTVDQADVLHIRGWALSPGADFGVSPIASHRHALGLSLAQQEFQGRFYRNNAAPPGVIQVPDEIEPDVAEAMLDYWMQNHAGLENAGRPGILYNGATWQSTGMSMADAQFIDSRKFSIEDIARIFRLSPQMLAAYVREGSTTAEDFERFLKVDLAPRFRRIELGVRADPDLFPSGDDLFPEFLADAVLRPDIKTRYEAYRLARQGGWMKPNEIREKENLPPADGGDEIQETPVGGAPNPGLPAR